MWGRARATDCYKFGTVRDTGDLINLVKRCIDRFRGIGLRKVQIWVFPYETATALNTVCCTNVHTHDRQHGGGSNVVEPFALQLAST